jgi:predicted aspartyl protease
MLHSFRSNLVLGLSSFTLLGLTACSPNAASNKIVPSAPPLASPGAPTIPKTTSTEVSAGTDPYNLALNKAKSATNFSQSAQSADDWNLVASRWQQAINLLQAVPASSPNQKQVKARLMEYQRNLAIAQKQASKIASATAEIEAANNSPSSDGGNSAGIISSNQSSSPSFSNKQGEVFQVRIKRRQGGTPVIDVTFNSSQTFEMIVDTGASGTVITQQMASLLRVKIIGTTKVDTASQKGIQVPLAKVDSISAGGVVVNNVVVAVGGPSLDVGLLGHDFFGNYDVTVKRDVIEFRSR